MHAVLTKKTLLAALLLCILAALLAAAPRASSQAGRASTMAAANVPHQALALSARSAVIVFQLLSGALLNVEQLPEAQFIPELRREAHYTFLRIICEEALDQEAL
jgi:hypothetical protein